MKRNIKYFVAILFFFIFILFLSKYPFAYEYDLVTRYLIHSDRGTYHHYPMQRIDYDPNGRIYVVYNAKAVDSIAVKYSTDNGQTWNQDDPNIDPGSHNPSIDINDLCDVSVTSSNPSFQYGPVYTQRNGSWAVQETIEDTSPFTCNNDTPQVLWQGDNNNPWCVFRTLTTVECSVKSGGSWGSPVAKTPGANVDSLAACMDDDNDVAYAAWRAQDPNTFYIQSAYFDGNSWSSVKTIESFWDDDGCSFPIIKFLDSTPTIMYYRTGVGDNNSYYQGRYAYADSNFNWSSPTTVTDEARNSRNFIPFVNSDGVISCIFVSYGIDPNNTGAYNLAYMRLVGGSWTTPIILTEEASNQFPVWVAMEGSTAHILMSEPATDKEYYASYDTAAVADYAQPILFTQ